MFDGGEMELRVITAHNANEEAGKFQEGGMAMLVFGDMIEQFDPEGLGLVDQVLGWWAFLIFSGEDRVMTRVICSYSPCANKKKKQGQCINNTNGI
jgi:hypothetical protein